MVHPFISASRHRANTHLTVLYEEEYPLQVIANGGGAEELSSTERYRLRLLTQGLIFFQRRNSINGNASKLIRVGHEVASDLIKIFGRFFREISSVTLSASPSINGTIIGLQTDESASAVHIF